MLITITAKHIEITDAIRTHAEEKVSKLPRYYDSISQIEVVIEGNEGGKQCVEIIVHAEHNNLLIAKETGNDTYTCIDVAVHKMERQLRKAKEKETLKFDNIPTSKDPIMVWKDLECRELIYQKIEPQVTRKAADVYRAIIDGESYRQIASRILKNSKNIKRINTIKEEIQQKYIGEAGEIVKEIILKNAGHDVERFGGNSPNPDIIDHTAKLVISVKTYTILNESKARSAVAASEIKAAIQLGYDCVLDVFSMKDALWYRYAVSLPATATGLTNGVLPTPPAEGSKGNTLSPFSSQERVVGSPASHRPPARRGRGRGGVSKRRQPKRKKKSKIKKNAKKGKRKTKTDPKDYDISFERILEAEAAVKEFITESVRENRPNLSINDALKDFSHEEKTALMLAFTSGQLKSCRFLSALYQSAILEGGK